jgi:hypothetical protein
MVVRHSGELLQAIRDRIESLGTTHASIEAVAGLQSNYLTKVTASPPPKRMSMWTAFLVLEAIGLRVELSVAPDFEERFAHRLEKRRLVRRPMRPAGRIVELTPDFYKRISRIGNDATSRKLSPERRSELARAAAAARWRRHREVIAA